MVLPDARGRERGQDGRRLRDAHAERAAAAAAVAAKGGAFLEAPVSGSKKPAADGQLIFLCAGAAAVLDAARADLELMGKATHYFGEAVGGGSKMKLCVNMTMGIQCAAVAEGAALCAAAGLEPAKFVEVLSQGAMASLTLRCAPALFHGGDDDDDDALTSTPPYFSPSSPSPPPHTGRRDGQARVRSARPTTSTAPRG